MARSHREKSLRELKKEYGRVFKQPCPHKKKSAIIRSLKSHDRYIEGFGTFEKWVAVRGEVVDFGLTESK